MNATTRIQPLGKNNYDTWKIQAEALLIKSGGWSYVNGTILKPAEDTGAATWTENDLKAKSDLILSIEVSELREIKHCKTSREVWQKLCTIHESKGPAKKATLLKQLLFTKMTEGDDTKTHLSKLETTVDKLRDMALEINEELLTIILLYSLPESFDNFRVAIESRDVLPTMENLKIKILEESESRHDRQENTPSNNAMAAWKQRESKQQGHQQQGHQRQGYPQQKWNKGNNNKKFMKCQNCKKKGHLAADCWFNKKNDESYYAIEQCSSVHEGIPKNNWILDSGCTSHMCNDKDEFINLTPSVNKVNMANQTNSETVGIGSVKLNVEIGNTSKTCDLSNTLYIPNLNLNLLSVSKITEKGYNVTFHHDKAIIRNMNGTPTTVAIKQDNLYVIKQAKSDEQVNVCNIQQDKDFDLWHNRFGHVNAKTLREMILKESVLGIKPLSKNMKTNTDCEICIQGKMTRKEFPKSSPNKVNELLEIVHTDVCGPIAEISNGGARYIVTFIDEKSRYTVVKMLKNKSDVYDAFVAYHKMAEVMTGQKLKYLQSDNGLEFINKKMNDYLTKHGIQRRLTAPYTPQQNGTAERKNRTLWEMARCMMIKSNCRSSFWGEAVAAANYIRNRCVSRSTSPKTPFEIWFGRKPVVTHLRMFGSKVYVLNKRPNRTKLETKTKLGKFVGYSEESKAYRIWIEEEKCIIISRDVKFLEGEFHESSPNDKISEGIEFNFLPPHDEEESAQNEEESAQNEEDSAQDEAEQDANEQKEEQALLEEYFEGSSEVEEHDESNDPEYTPSVYQEDNDNMQTPRRSNRKTCPKQWNDFYCNIVMEEPYTYQEASEGDEKHEWHKAMQDEMKSLKDNKTWTLVDKPTNTKILSCKWVYKRKTDKYKARLVAKGFSQIQGVNYTETYSPVIRHETVRLLFALAAKLEMKIHQMDIETAYLQGNLHDEIYMHQPEGFVNQDEPQKVCKLQKPIYGLKQGGREWNRKLNDEVTKMGYNRSKADPCLYYQTIEDELIIIVTYVDDILIFCKNEDIIRRCKLRLTEAFKIRDLGIARKFLGIRIKQNWKNGTISLDQTEYINTILQRFGLSECNSVKTPMPVGTKFEDTNEEEVDTTLYQEMVGCLMYVSCITRPDITYATSYMSRFVKKPLTIHLNAVKRIYRYLKGTTLINLSYKYSQELDLKVYSDADWGNDLSTRHSVTGYILTLQNGAICWKSRLQKTVALSTAEAEYMALAEAVQELTWVRNMFQELLPNETRPTPVFCDNKSTICLSDSEAIKQRTKHIDIKFHFVKEKVATNDIEIIHLETNQMVADYLTKPVNKEKQAAFRISSGLAFRGSVGD